MLLQIHKILALWVVALYLYLRAWNTDNKHFSGTW